MINIILKLAINEWNLFLLFFISIIALIILSEFIFKKFWSNNTNRKIIHIIVGISSIIYAIFFHS